MQSKLHSLTLAKQSNSSAPACLSKLLVCAALAVATPAAYAEDFSYDYADLAFTTSDGFNGARLRGSYEFLQDVRAIGEVTLAGNGPADFTSFSIGAGYIFGINEQANVIADVGFRLSLIHI